MEDKLKQLTTRIYAEGVEKAREEAAVIRREAEDEARHILEKARREADAIREQARREADSLRQSVAAELQLTTRQAVRALKQQITDLIATRMLGEPLNQAFDDAAYIRQLIDAAVSRWDPTGSPAASVALILPEAARGHLDAYIAGRTADLLNQGLDVSFDGRLDSGFRVGPGDGRYLISFTREGFDEFFREYVRPRISELLYNEEE